MAERRTKSDTGEQGVRTWFAEHGWRLQPGELRAALQERGADEDLVIELLDEGADRRRAEEAKTRPEPTTAPAAASNGRGRGGGPVPPQNLEAEESVLGAMMLAPAAIQAVREILQPGDFYRESHAKIYRAALELADTGAPVDAITLTDELEKRGDLEAVGGRVRIHEIAALVPTSANVAHYARIVHETATLRGLIRVGAEAARLGWERPGDAAQLVDQVREMVGGLEERVTGGDEEQHLVGGGDFILDAPGRDDAIWGGGDGQIAWAPGEGLMICGPQGVGKTTVMQQVALARAGLLSRVLGMEVTPDERGVLYVAADRPRQAARSLARMVDEHNRDDLNERLKIWRGPLPFLLNEQPTALARLCERHGIGTVCLDSVKDVAVRISEDEPAAKFNMAVQHCLAAGIEVVCAHHQRKAQQGAPKPKTLADVYGNTWLTAGMGSVIILWGDPGDPIVELTHLKQPVEEIGPWNIRHDHDRGLTLRYESVTVEELLTRAGAHGLTAQVAAGMLRQTDTPSRNEIEKARRQLAKLVDRGLATEQPGDRTQPSRFYPREPRVNA